MHTVKELETLAHRWKACKHFAWMQGMYTTDGEVIVGFNAIDDARVVDAHGDIVTIRAADLPTRIPDLWDHATEGVLYASLARRHPGLCIARTVHGLWFVTAWEGEVERRMAHGRSRLSALVAAWEQE